MQQQSPRRLRRHHLIFYLKVFDRVSQDQLGVLGDITSQGMMVMSREPIEPGRVFDIELRNHSGLDDDVPVRCQARSLWCQTDTNPDYFAIGFQFDEVPPESAQAIRSLIREIGFDH